MAPISKRARFNQFIDDEAEVADSPDEQEEEEEENSLDGFFNDEEEPVPQQPHGLPRSLVSATDSGGNDQEEIERYIKSIKKRAQDSSRMRGNSSSTQDRRLELWMLPVPAGLEPVIARSLDEFSQKTRSDVRTYHVSYLPRRVYLRAPGIAEIQELCKFSAYSHLVSRASRVSEDIDLDFLHGTSVPEVPSIGSWVRILQPGTYQGDLAVVFSKPSTGDIVTIAVVPRFRTKKRKGKGNARPPSALLDPNFLAKVPPNEENIHLIKSREFSSNGLEFLRAASAHALKIEPRPFEVELLPFRSSLLILDKRYQLDAVLHYALSKALSNESRRLWRTGDRVQIVQGAFVGTSTSIREIDFDNGSLVVEFGSPKVTSVDVSLEDVERHFLVGDQVRVALGENKGRTGSIIAINDGVSTIVEGTASQVIEFQSPLQYLESHDLPPSFASTAHPAAASMSKPKPSDESEASKGLQMLRGRDPRLGKEAALYVGSFKGYQGRLININRDTGTIEWIGRHPPNLTAPLRHIVLIDEPTHNLAGTKLNRPYVGRFVERPEPSVPRTSTPPPPADEQPELTLAEREIELGSGAFLRDPQICANLEGFHVWVGFHDTFRNGSYTARHGYTPLPDMFTDANGQCANHEVCILLTDNNGGIAVPQRVELRHLKPAPPRKRGDWIVIMYGDHQGVVTEVIACRLKTSKVEVVIDGAKMAFDFRNICRLKRPE